MSTLFGRRKRAREPAKPSQSLQKSAKDLSIPKDTFQDDDEAPASTDLDKLGLENSLVESCRALGYREATEVQQKVIPFLLKDQKSSVLALSATGSGKTAAFVLPILHHWCKDPYGIYAVILTPTRELAQQIHQQVMAIGSRFRVQSTLVVGGLDGVQQAISLRRDRPPIVVATPGRLAALLRGPDPPQLNLVRYLVLDEADRLLVPGAGFEKDVAEVLLQCRSSKRVSCQSLLFSATMTASLESMEEMAGAGNGRLPLRKFIVGKKLKSDETTASEEQDNEEHEESEETNKKAAEATNTNEIPKIPAGLKQEYVFMPARVRDAYLLAALRTLMAYGGRSPEKVLADNKAKRHNRKRQKSSTTEDEDPAVEATKARSTIIFVATCERAALVSGILEQVGVSNVALHSLLSQNRRLAALAKFQSEHVRVLVATDVASRGLDIPSVDLVINASLPRSPITYLHRVGRTARAGRRGHAVSLVAPNEVALVHAAERMAGRPLEKSESVSDELALTLLSPVLKAARVVKMKLMDIGFEELVEKFRDRKARDKKERRRIQKALQSVDA